MSDPQELAHLVFFVRGERVMLDADLAALYGIEARALNQAVKRNRNRFPTDFMFQLSPAELKSLWSQIVTTYPPLKGPNSSQFVMSSRKYRGRAYRPYAFTEQGVAMLSSVLRSRRAVEVNIAIMRTFVQLRKLMDSNRDLARRIDALEKKYDEQFANVFAAIKQLITEPSPPRRQIGFHPWVRFQLSFQFSAFVCLLCSKLPAPCSLPSTHTLYRRKAN
jgi:ORF6N domain.